MDEVESGRTHARPLHQRFGRVENVRILDLTDARSRMGHFYIRLVSLHLDGKMFHQIVYEFFVPLDALRYSLNATVLLHGTINQLLHRMGSGIRCFIYNSLSLRIL